MIFWVVLLLILFVAFVLYACCYVSGDEQPSDEYGDFDKFNDWEK